MIVTITPNVAIDRTAVVDRFEFDTVLRPEDLVVLPGGKGVNVARAASRLGAHVMTTGLAGGDTGRWINRALAAEGLNPRLVACGAEARTTYVLIDSEGKTLLIYEKGPKFASAEVGLLLSLLKKVAPIAGYIVLSGSLPDGMPPGFAAEVVDISHAAGRPILVDTSGPPLRAAIDAGPDIVKISVDEAMEIGLAGESPDPARIAAEKIVRKGSRICIVTEGSAGAVGFDGRRVWRARPPSVTPISPVGSGDSFTAGLLVGLTEYDDLEPALALATAAGAANTLTLGAGVLDPDTCRRLARDTEVTVLED